MIYPQVKSNKTREENNYHETIDRLHILHIFAVESYQQLWVVLLRGVPLTELLSESWDLNSVCKIHTLAPT